MFNSLNSKNQRKKCITQHKLDWASYHLSFLYSCIAHRFSWCDIAATWALKSDDEVKLADLGAMLSVVTECLLCARHRARKHQLKTLGRLKEFIPLWVGGGLLRANVKLAKAWYGRTFTAHHRALSFRLFSNPPAYMLGFVLAYTRWHVSLLH